MQTAHEWSNSYLVRLYNKRRPLPTSSSGSLPEPTRTPNNSVDTPLEVIYYVYYVKIFMMDLNLMLNLNWRKFLPLLRNSHDLVSWSLTTYSSIAVVCPLLIRLKSTLIYPRSLSMPRRELRALRNWRASSLPSPIECFVGNSHRLRLPQTLHRPRTLVGVNCT